MLASRALIDAVLPLAIHRTVVTGQLAHRMPLPDSGEYGRGGKKHLTPGSAVIPNQGRFCDSNTRPSVYIRRSIVESGDSSTPLLQSCFALCFG
jgi:hypothetical protein